MVAVRLGDGLSPQHTYLKADPGERKGRQIPILPDRSHIHPICVLVLSDIGKERAQRHQVLESPGGFRYFLSLCKYRRQLLSQSLLNR
jgi:hypothetical protein